MLITDKLLRTMILIDTISYDYSYMPLMFKHQSKHAN